MSFQINKAAVLGAGVMGASIAAHLVGAGIPVILLDRLPDAVTDEERARGLTLEHPAVRNRYAQAGKDRVINPKFKSIYDPALGALIEVGNFTDHMARIGTCDWIIEVIVEDLEVKKAFMQQIAEHRKPFSIVSSNTSGISINAIASELPQAFRQHFLGTHFFNPPRYMKLFELIPGRDTLPTVVAFMKAFAEERLGKGVVLAKDTPNFVGNRIGTFAIASTTQLMEQYGYSISKTDLLTGPVLGRPRSATFRTLDMVGIDVYHHVIENVMNAVEDPEEKAIFKTPELILELVKSNRLGDKTRGGFYKKVKTDSGTETQVWDGAQKCYVPKPKETVDAVSEALRASNTYEAMVYGSAEENQFAWDAIKRVLLYSAQKIPEIADDFRAIDNAMMWGFNWELGPFGIWDAIGLERSVQRMRQEGEAIPDWIERKLASGSKAFYESGAAASPYLVLGALSSKTVADNGDAALIDLGDDVLCLQFKTKGNTITDPVIEMMYKAVEETEKNYKGLVIGNQGKNFSAGANLMRVGKLATDKNWAGLERMVTAFQSANMAVKYCKKPVVAAPHGMTLGGGAEVVMHAHRVCAHAETYMGLVEVGVGLIPGGGGTKELLVRSMEALGKVKNGERLSHIQKVWERIAMAKVSSSAHDAKSKGYMRGCDRVVMNADALIDVAKAEVLHMVRAGFSPLYEKPIPVLGNTGRAALAYGIDFMRSGGFISAYDAHIANKLAYILTGGNVPAGVSLTEAQVLELEKEAFVSLCGEEKTLQRIDHMLRKGKPLRN